jgi:MoaA/NifB/PqqE/SkfB family radical SAM enzyme
MSGYSSNQLFMGDSKPGPGHSNPTRWIETGRALRLLDEFAELGVLAVQFTGGGEPTVHPNHEAIFEKALSLGLRCSLVTNGVKMSNNLIDNLLPRFDLVRVSIDAGRPDSYAKTRRTPEAHWERVWRNVHRLSAALRTRGSLTSFGLGFVVTPESYLEIPTFTALAKAAGVGNVRFTAMFSTESEKPFVAIYDQVKSLIMHAKRQATPKFAVYDNFGSRFDDLKQHRPDYQMCPYQYYTSYVGGDLRAYRCCVLAYNERGKISGGDLTDRSFADFWRDPVTQMDLKRLDPRGCERCQFNAKNRGLLYVMGNTESDVTPRHMEWP